MDPGCDTKFMKNYFGKKCVLSGLRLDLIK